MVRRTHGRSRFLNVSPRSGDPITLITSPPSDLGTPRPRHPGTVRSSEELQTWYVDSSLVERCRLDLGDDECPAVGAAESYVRDLGAGYRNLLDHFARWIEDRDFAPTKVGDVEVASFVKGHAVWPVPAGEKGKILTGAEGAVRLDR